MVAQSQEYIDAPDLSLMRKLYIEFFGLFLAYPCGGLMGLAPSFSLMPHVLAGIVMAWVLHPWVVRGELPTSWTLIGWAALSVNLLSAGVTSYPGLAVRRGLLRQCVLNSL